jgi:integrase
MIERLPKTSQRIFNCTYTSLKTSLRFSRKRISRNLNNPRLLKITFHTLRHWKATMEYHQTKDILHVKELLGHRKLDTTTMYIQIAEALFQHEPEAFTVKVAKDPRRNNRPPRSRLRMDRRKRRAILPEETKVTFSRKY